MLKLKQHLTYHQNCTIYKHHNIELLTLTNRSLCTPFFIILTPLLQGITYHNITQIICIYSWFTLKKEKTSNIQAKPFITLKDGTSHQNHFIAKSNFPCKYGVTHNYV
jgi:hypothetical protein